MFVFGSAAKADADSDGGGGRGKASSTTDGALSFAFDASSLPSVNSTTTANGDDEGFKFKMPSSQAATEGGESGDSTPLFGSIHLKSGQEVGVNTQTLHEAATDGSSTNPMGDQLQQPTSEPEVFLLYEGGDVVDDLRKKLTHVRVAPHVRKIPNLAFRGCGKLIDLQLNEGLQVIGELAFEECKSLRNVTLPSTVTKLGDMAFANCENLIELQLKEGLWIIGEYAFEDCSALMSVTIPSTVTELGSCAFYYCRNLSDVIFLGGKRLLNQEYVDCGFRQREEQGLLNQEALDEMLFGDFERRDFAFLGCPLTMVKISISWAVTERMARLPQECKLSVEERIHNLNRLELEDGDVFACFPVVLRRRSKRAPDDDQDDDIFEVLDTNHETARSLHKVLQLLLVDVQLNEGLRILDSFAFEGCTSLRSVIIPSTVTHLGWCAFYGCSNLSEVIFLGKRLLNQEFFDCRFRRKERELLDQDAIDEMFFDENWDFAFSDCSLNKVKVSISWAVSDRMARLPRECRLSVEEKIHNLRRLELLQDGNVLACFPVVRRTPGNEAVGDSDDDQDDVIFEVCDTDHETARSLHKVLQLIAFHELKESSIVIELAMWKSRIDVAMSVPRADCRVAIPDPAKSLIMKYGGFAGFLKPVIEGA